MPGRNGRQQRAGRQGACDRISWCTQRTPGRGLQAAAHCARRSSAKNVIIRSMQTCAWVAFVRGHLLEEPALENRG